MEMYRKALETGLYVVVMLWDGLHLVMVFDYGIYQLTEFYQFHSLMVC